MPEKLCPPRYEAFERRRTTLVAACVLLAATLWRSASAAPVAPAEAGRWRPRDVVSRPVSADAVRDRVAALRAQNPPVLHRLKLTLRGASVLHVDALARGADVRFDIAIGDAHYAMGRLGGVRWRRTPNGVSRIIHSDVQGDDLDRWPAAPFVPPLDGCSAIGTSDAGDVLACRDGLGEARFFYVSRTGRIEREVLREGSRASTFRFRYASDAATFPAGWTIEGAGGDAQVTVDDDRAAGGAGNDSNALDPPFEQPAPFALAGDGAVRVATVASYGAAFADVSVNGHTGRFQVDDGTTQMLLDTGFARRAGIATTFGHGIAEKIDVGPLRGRNVAVQTADIGFVDGILGFEFFLGCIVHVDYVANTVELIPRATFAPPGRARELKMDVTEGMPLLEGGIGSIAVDRIVPDLGSSGVVIPRSFADRRTGDAGVHVTAGPYVTQRYLEGPVLTSEARIDRLRIGTFRWENVKAAVEPPTPEDIDIPLDAIVGTSILRSFEWWFDADGGRAYVVPR